MSTLIDSQISEEIHTDLKSSTESIIQLGGDQVKNVKTKTNTTTNKNTKTKNTTEEKINKSRKKKETDVKTININKISELTSIDYRDFYMNYKPEKNKTKNRITENEIALVLGKRATQIENGAKPFIEVKPGMSVIDIAKQELIEKKIPYMIKRTIGNETVIWKLKDLQIKEF